jgi:hypothetical protein
VYGLGRQSNAGFISSIFIICVSTCALVGNCVVRNIMVEERVGREMYGVLDRVCRVGHVWVYVRPVILEDFE